MLQTENDVTEYAIGGRTGDYCFWGSDAMLRLHERRGLEVVLVCYFRRGKGGGELWGTM